MEPEKSRQKIRAERIKNMKKKLVMAAVLSLTLMAAGCSNGDTKTTEAGTEAASETSSEAESSAETEAAERPDYRALDYVTLGEYKGLPVTLASTAVTDEEIDAEITSTLSQKKAISQISTTRERRTARLSTAERTRAMI